MKILVYGAGPLGSLFAARLRAGGHAVSILARGERLADLRARGIVLQDALGPRRTVTHVDVVERLEPDDRYDLILVIMRKNCVRAILPALAASRAPNVLFLMNNAAGPGELVEALGPERVLIGFPSSAGYRRGHVVYCLAGTLEHPASIPIGEVDGRVTARTREVADALGRMPGYKVQIRTDMDAWLKTHAALLMPSIAPALYAAAGDRRRLGRTRDALVLAARAVREGFRVLEARGIPITPAGLKLFEVLPEPVVVAWLRRLTAREVMDVALVAHARSARDEVRCLADEFMAPARATRVPTPAIDRLYPYLDACTPPLPDGQAALGMDWRGVWAGLALLAALLGGSAFAAARLRRRPA